MFTYDQGHFYFILLSFEANNQARSSRIKPLCNPFEL